MQNSQIINHILDNIDKKLELRQPNKEAVNFIKWIKK